MKDHETFAQEYARSGNATAAARLAGYKNGNVIGSRLSKLPKIVARVAEIKSEITKQIATDWVAEARRLNDKAQWQAEILKLLSEANSQERLRIHELFGKSAGHFSLDQANGNILNLNFINLSPEELAYKARMIADKLRLTAYNVADNVIPLSVDPIVEVKNE